MALDQLVEGQAEAATQVNENFDAIAPASLFGRQASTSNLLTWGYYGGYMVVDGVLTSISDGTVSLTASNTNYIEATRAGVVSANTTGFTAGSIPLYSAVADGTTVTSYIDYRALPVSGNYVAGKLAKSMASDANVTLTAAEARNNILVMTSGVSLTATRNVVLPLSAQQWTVFNNTTGGQSLQFIGATGTGITVANAKRAIIYADGTNIVRVTADT